MAKPTSTPSLRDLALDAITVIASQLRAADPSLSKAQSVAKAAQTPEGRSAYQVYRLPGADQPFTEVLAHLAKGGRFLPAASMRDAILAKRAEVAKEGGSGGSGPRGGRIEDPKISGPKAPADGLPAQRSGRKLSSPVSPADVIYARIRSEAVAAAPAGTSEPAAISNYLATTAGQKLHAEWNGARRAAGS